MRRVRKAQIRNGGIMPVSHEWLVDTIIILGIRAFTLRLKRYRTHIDRYPRA